MVRTLHGRWTFLVAACLRKSRRGETVDVTMLARDASLAHRVRIAPPSPDARSAGNTSTRCCARGGGLDHAQAFRTSRTAVGSRCKVQGRVRRLRCRPRRVVGSKPRPTSTASHAGKRWLDVDGLTSTLTPNVAVEGDVRRRLHRRPRRQPRFLLASSSGPPRVLRVHLDDPGPQVDATGRAGQGAGITAGPIVHWLNGDRSNSGDLFGRPGRLRDTLESHGAHDQG